MAACLDTILCCIRRPGANNKFMYRTEVMAEHGIEYDRLIELPEHIQNTGRIPQIISERERHLISNKLYSEYALDQERLDRDKERELIEEEELLAEEEERLYAQKADKIRKFYSERSAVGSTAYNFADFSEEDAAERSVEQAKRLQLLEAEGDYEKFLEMIKSENSLTEVVLYAKEDTSSSAESEELDYDLNVDDEYCL